MGAAPAEPFRFVGRRSELDDLRAVVCDAGGSALLTGPAGIGKTATAHRLVHQVEGRVGVCEVAATRDNLVVPLGPFLPLLAPADDVPTSVADRLLFIERKLVQRARPLRLLLIVDDAPFLDPASFALVRSLILMRRQSVILTARSTDVWPSGLTDLAKDGLLVRVELEPLPRHSVDEVATAYLGGEVERGVLDALWRMTEGNPLFVREVLASGVADESIVRVHDQWRLDGGLHASPLLRDILGRRVDALPGPRRSLLDALGEADALPLDVATHFCTLDDIVELEDAGLVATQEGPPGILVTCGHPLWGEVVRELMSQARLRRVRQQLVTALDEVAVDDDGTARLRGRLELAVGRGDPQILESASRGAGRLGDGELALACARAAVDAGAGFGARLALANAAAAMGQVVEAEAIYLDLADDARSPAERAHVAIAYATSLAFQQLGDLDRAAEVLERSIGEQPAREAGELLSMLAYVRLLNGEFDRGLEIARSLNHRSASAFVNLAGVRTAQAGIYAVRGMPAEAIACADEGLAEIDRSKVDPSAFGSLVPSLVWSRFLGFWQSGRAPDAIDPAAPLRGPNTCALADHIVVRSLMPVGLAIMCGHLDAVASSRTSILDRAFDVSTDAGSFGFFAELLEVGAHAMRGEVAVSEGLLRDLVNAPHARVGIYRWWVERARLLVLAAQGRRREAAVRSLELADEHSSDSLLTTISLHDAVRNGYPEMARSALHRQAARREATWFDRVCSEHADATDGCSFSKTSATFEEGGILHYSCEAAAQAARAHRDEGEMVDATLAEFSMRRLLTRCGDLATYAIDPVAPLLTDREFEVAHLAATGLTNKQIAAHLGSSPRTVGNQLQRAYEKLQIHSRDQLAAQWPKRA